MSEYISLGEVLGLASKASECNLRQVPRKKIMFQGRKPNGESVTLCSPQAKKQPQGFYWVDITQEHITLHADKEILMMVVEKSIRDTVLNAIYKEMDMAKKAKGIAFSLPVSDVAGLAQKVDMPPLELD